MIRSVRVLFCDQEHGFGDITFPDVRNLDMQDLIQPRTAKQLRADAKKAGWTHDRRGRDYCDCCSGAEE
jgi:predicted dienelactone hydrolase